MARSWRTVRVFISSTFRDMHAERGHLVKVVFPALRERLEPHRIHLVDIDLRWGVTAEQADNDKVLELCLDEFGEKVKADLLAAMGREYPEILKEPPPPARPGTEDWLVDEQDLHERFMESRLQVYIGRDLIHKQLLEYLEGDSDKPLSEDNTLRVWNLEDGRCIAVDQVRDQVGAISKMMADGKFIAAEGIFAIILRLCNLRIEPPFVTPVRIWIAGQWEAAISERLPAT